MKHIKCVVVGDAAVGKTCFLRSFVTNEFTHEYIPTIFENFSKNVMFEDQNVNLQIWDTGGLEDYEKLRTFSYSETDVFIICFSLVNPTSLDNVTSRWLPQNFEHCPDTPFILVGLKSDIRDEFETHPDELKQKGMEPISHTCGEQMKERIGAYAYIECSSLKFVNLKEVFDEAIKAVLHPNPNLGSDFKSEIRKKQIDSEVGLIEKQNTPKKNRKIKKKQIKCVVVGDEAVGKTCLLRSFTTHAFPDQYYPTAFDNYSTNVLFEDQSIKLQLWDTAAVKSLEGVRRLSYPETDVFIICFFSCFSCFSR